MLGKRWQAVLGLLIACSIGVGCKDSRWTEKQQEKTKTAAKDQHKGPPPKRKVEFYGRPDLHESFSDATLSVAPDGQLEPPSKTMAGKDVSAMYDRIAGNQGVGGLWDETSFFADDGQRLRYFAKLQTKLGDIKIELWPEIAPNHVRNFIVLAKVDYFDGLNFHRIVNQSGGDRPDFRSIEAGCPQGTGDSHHGSIGYWLKPEISDSVKHEPGTIGAVHTAELENAACKFYIALTKAPWMDRRFTVFGRIVEGLEVAERISRQPTTPDDMPEDPVLIKRVTIESLQSQKQGSERLAEK